MAKTYKLIPWNELGKLQNSIGSKDTIISTYWDYDENGAEVGYESYWPGTNHLIDADLDEAIAFLKAKHPGISVSQFIKEVDIPDIPVSHPNSGVDNTGTINPSGTISHTGSSITDPSTGTTTNVGPTQTSTGGFIGSFSGGNGYYGTGLIESTDPNRDLSDKTVNTIAPTDVTSTIRGTKKDGVDTYMLSDSSPVAAVVVNYKGGTKKILEAVKNSDYDKFVDGAATAPILNRYGASSGIYDWSYSTPNSNGDIRYEIKDFFKPLKDDAAAVKPSEYPDRNYISSDGDDDDNGSWVPDWRNVDNMDGGSDQTYIYNIKTPANATDENNLVFTKTNQSTPRIDEFYIPFNSAIKSNAGGGFTIQEVDSIEIFFDIKGRQSEVYDSTGRDYMRAKWGTYLINHIKLKTSNTNETVTNQPASFEAVPFRYSTEPKSNIDYKWKLREAKYIDKYWNQFILYGFDKEISSSEYTPTNYVMVSDFNNPGYIPSTKILDAFDNNNDPITKTLAWKNGLLTFTETSTTLFQGRVPETKELVHSAIGLPEKYRNTAQVVSDSVVFKNADSVFAFVPASGTEGAGSLRVRDLAQQIKPYITAIERDNVIKKIDSTIYHNDEYWLMYSLQDKTVIFKYDWSKYSWIIDEYPVSFTSFMKLTSDKLLGVDPQGNIYELLSNNSEKFLTDYEFRIKRLKYNLGVTETNSSFVNSPLVGDENYKLLIDEFYPTISNINDNQDILDAKAANDFEGQLTTLQNDLGKMFDGVWQDVIYSQGPVYNIESIDDTGRKTYQPWSSGYFAPLHKLRTLPISYEFQLGARKPGSDAGVALNDLTLLIGNDSNYPITDQHFEIYTNGIQMLADTIDIGARTTASSSEALNNKWAFGSSVYQRPTPDKHTRKIRRAATTIDAIIHGETSSKLYLDSLVFRYMMTTRKRR